jgi:hypothetical protein
MRLTGWAAIVKRPVEEWGGSVENKVKVARAAHKEGLETCNFNSLYWDLHDIALLASSEKQLDWVLAFGKGLRDECSGDLLTCLPKILDRRARLAEKERLNDGPAS